MKIDLLECLKDVWGESVLIARDNIYKIVSGDTDDETYHKLICAYYRTHASFANFVDFCYMNCPEDVPFISRFISETREVIHKYGLKVDDIVMNRYTGSKFLLEDNEYCYYAVSTACDLSELKGVTYIQ